MRGTGCKPGRSWPTPRPLVVTMRRSADGARTMRAAKPTVHGIVGHTLLRLTMIAGRWRLARALVPVLTIMAIVAGSPPAVAANPEPKEDVATIGGPFTLVDQDGRAVTDQTYRGKWLLIYFGYTHCPDSCPTALSNMSEALDLVDAGLRDRLQPIFVTVDPERDTPAVMKDYVGAFEGADIVGLSGTREQVTAAETAYRIFAQRHDEADGEYRIDHTSVIHIVDPAGRFAGLVSNLMQPERLAKHLMQLVK
jgi:protein SCO1/2